MKKIILLFTLFIPFNHTLPQGVSEVKSLIRELHRGSIKKRLKALERLSTINSNLSRWAIQETLTAPYPKLRYKALEIVKQKKLLPISSKIIKRIVAYYTNRDPFFVIDLLSIEQSIPREIYIKIESSSSPIFLDILYYKKPLKSIKYYEIDALIKDKDIKKSILGLYLLKRLKNKNYIKKLKNYLKKRQSFLEYDETKIYLLTSLSYIEDPWSYKKSIESILDKNFKYKGELITSLKNYRKKSNETLKFLKKYKIYKTYTEESAIILSTYPDEKYAEIIKYIYPFVKSRETREKLASFLITKISCKDKDFIISMLKDEYEYIRKLGIVFIDAKKCKSLKKYLIYTLNDPSPYIRKLTSLILFSFYSKEDIKKIILYQLKLEKNQSVKNFYRDLLYFTKEEIKKQKKALINQQSIKEGSSSRK